MSARTYVSRSSDPAPRESERSDTAASDRWWALGGRFPRWRLWGWERQISVVYF